VPSKLRKQVVVIGGGFGGLAVTRALARAAVQVTLVDRRNHHLFQPLLYQVAMAGLSPAEIAVPIRSVLRRQKNARRTFVIINWAWSYLTYRRGARLITGRDATPSATTDVRVP
jgi:NADH dehydrogenase FAD-containing subunit